MYFIDIETCDYFVDYFKLDLFLNIIHRNMLYKSIYNLFFIIKPRCTNLMDLQKKAMPFMIWLSISKREERNIFWFGGKDIPKKRLLGNQRLIYNQYQTSTNHIQHSSNRSYKRNLREGLEGLRFRRKGRQK